MPRTVGAVISSGLATAHELATIYGIEDLHDMLEIVHVDAHNRRAIRLERERASQR